MSETPLSGLSVDWTIPIWGVLGLALQAIAAVWFFAIQSEKVSNLETRVATVERKVEIIGRLDERTKSMYDSLQRIESRTAPK